MPEEGALSGAGLRKADPSAEALAKAEVGMATMFKRFHEEGGELYVPSD